MVLQFYAKVLIKKSQSNLPSCWKIMNTMKIHHTCRVNIRLSVTKKNVCLSYHTRSLMIFFPLAECPKNKFLCSPFSFFICRQMAQLASIFDLIFAVLIFFLIVLLTFAPTSMSIVKNRSDDGIMLWCSEKTNKDVRLKHFISQYIFSFIEF